MFQFTETALKVLKERYYQEKETEPEHLFRRVARTVSMGDIHLEEEFFNIMMNTLFLPNSPTLFGAGTGLQQLAACFVVPINDSMESIYGALKDSAIIQKSGGGTGFDFSNIRPEGSSVNSTKKAASGPVSFMSLFNKSAEVIKQGGRRSGANMGILRVDHPDILKFIKCKRDKKSFQCFNISVAVTEDFMNAVVCKDESFNLIDPRTKEITETINPNIIFDEICQMAWETGDPGLIFIDEINKHNTTPELGRITATNPCVTGDTRILTDNGYVRIDSVVGEKVNIWNGHEWSEVIPEVTGENIPVLKVLFSDGSELKCTEYHRFELNDNTIKKTIDLKEGDKLIKCDWPVIFDFLDADNTQDYVAYTRGFFSGDGYYHTDKKANFIDLYDDKKDIIDFMYYDTEISLGSNNDNRRRIKLINNDWKKEFIPPVEWSISARLYWLAGLIDSDGSRNSEEGSISISSINRDFLIEVKLMLNTLGVHSSVVLMKESDIKEMPDGKGDYKKYETQDSFRLLISAYYVCELNKIGLRTFRVDTSSNPNRNASRYVCVDKIIYHGIADKVYCFNEPKRHKGIFNGVNTLNCGEQPLLPYEACNLGSIDISKFYDPKTGEVNWKELKIVVHLAVMFLDNVIDVCDYPLPVVTDAVKKTRKIGLGVMGFASLLYKMGITYGTNKSMTIAEEIMIFIKEESEKASAKRASDKGGYDYARSPYRNATRTTIAPTGSLSIIADCSGGIEPVYNLIFERNILNDKFYEINKDFRDAMTQKGVVITEEIAKEIAEKGSIQHIKEIPFDIRHTFVTSKDITVNQHISMQAVFQRYTDNAVSKTINMGVNATVSDIKKAYIEAYVNKCKGVTVYRDGTYDNQPMQSKSVSKPKEDRRKPATKTKREDVMDAKVSTIKTGFGDMYVVVSEKEGKPFDVFAIISKCGKSIMAKTEAIGRLISIALRYGIPVSEIVEQLSGISGEYPTFGKEGLVKSIPDGIGKVLEKLYVNKEKLKKIENTLAEIKQCPDCGSILIYEEGCNKCYGCGYSKCGE